MTETAASPCQPWWIAPHPPRACRPANTRRRGSVHHLVVDRGCTMYAGTGTSGKRRRASSARIRTPHARAAESPGRHAPSGLELATARSRADGDRIVLRCALAGRISSRLLRADASRPGTTSGRWRRRGRHDAVGHLVDLRPCRRPGRGSPGRGASCCRGLRPVVVRPRNRLCVLDVLGKSSARALDLGPLELWRARTTGSESGR